MTNINCLADCIYQKDGKCKLESVTAMAVTADNSCAYYSKAPKSRAAFEGSKRS
ncbi:MAG: hypothetical protein M0R40_03400 [Firmicutes bacterium]|nr:hypothetical protein [Bacillota bacterium]